MRALRFLPLVILAVFILILPATATQISFHVSVVGDGILHPGDEIPLTLIIQNDARYTGLFNENISEMLPMLTLAKNLRVELDSVYGVVEVKNVDEQVLGDLPSGVPARAVFLIKIPEDAREGEHSIPLKLKYTRVEYDPINQKLVYFDERDLEYFKISIKKKDYDFSILSVSSDLVAGKEGLVEVKIKNIGLNTIEDAMVLLNCTPPIQPNPKAMSAFLGDLKSGEERTIKFKVYVMSGALNQTYPANLMLNFKMHGRPMVLFKPLGLQVKAEDHFSLANIESFVSSPKTIRVSPSASLSMSIPGLSGLSIPSMGNMGKPGMSGMPSLPSIPSIPSMPLPSTPSAPSSMSSVATVPSRGYISLTLTNVGEDVSDAYAFLSFDTPSIQVENSPYIGELGKGESRELTFYLRNFAPPGDYMGYLIVRYINKLGDEELSGKLYLKLHVSAEPALKVLKSETRELIPGMTGELILNLEDSIDASSANLYLLSPESGLKAVSSSAFVDDFSKDVRFRISADGDIVSGLYTLYLIESFSTAKAKDLVSIAEVPVKVESKSAYFEIVSIESSELYPDSTGYITVKIRNSGTMDVQNAVLKLELTPPLSVAGGSAIGGMIGQSQPGTYFIGKLKPGDTAIAKFRVEVDKDAGEGMFPVKIQLEYRDSQGYMHTSDEITTSVEVKEKPAITPLIGGALVLAVIALVIAARFARKRRSQK
ncbi:MAG: hypothetical protein H0Z28_00665 [Archaeoglobus sp.]|nr:hypothetical protein [Archaeoglobus sp.]